MRLRVFSKKNKVFIISFGLLCCLFFFLTIFLIYRSFALYEESQDFSVIHGSVPDQNYDLQISFVVVDDQGNRNYVKEMPNGRDWTVEVECSNDATAFWDYKNWSLITSNFTLTKTKCYLSFYPYVAPLADYGVREQVVDHGSGLYEVPHDTATITYIDNEEERNILKQTEYRYAGDNPQNNVLFNEEIWRIIGLVNTPEGPRLKLVRNESIGSYSYDTSAAGLNGGDGINEWSQADIMTLLNKGPYYNRSNGTCYNARFNGTVTCDFRTFGLMDDYRYMVDMITWNTGSNDGKNYKVNSISILDYYNLERSNNTGKICSGGDYCNDGVVRKVTWKGKVGLMYPSDYGYATSGGESVSRKECQTASNWNGDAMKDCRVNNWMSSFVSSWLISPIALANDGTLSSNINNDGLLSGRNSYVAMKIFPSVYLKENFLICEGEGTSEHPYRLCYS